MEITGHQTSHDRDLNGIQAVNTCLGLLEKRYYFRVGFQPVQIIRPRLHHFAPIRQMFTQS
jgi:hypothetical protein